MKISEHFDSSEFDQPARHGMPAVSYPQEWYDRLALLCKALEVIRAAFGRPMTVLSGFRSFQYNEAVYREQGKVPTNSQHTQGRAADITVEGVSAADLHAKVLELYKAGKIDIGGLGKYPGFVHVDVRRGWDHLARWEDYGS